MYLSASRRLFSFTASFSRSSAMVELVSQGVLQFDDGLVLLRRRLLAGKHFLANLQDLSLAGFQGDEPLVLEPDQLLFSVRELPVRGRHALFHVGDPPQRPRQGR